MNIKSYKTSLLVFLAILGLVFFIYQFKATYLSAFINIRFTRQQVIDQARQSLIKWGYQDNHYPVNAQFRVREGLLRYLHKSVSVDSLEKVLGNQLPAYYWAVTWVKPDKDSPEPDSIPAFPAWFRQVGIHFDQNGQEIAFWVEAADDSSAPSTDEQTARIMADSLLHVRLGPDTSLFAFNKIKSISRENRTDYSVLYDRKTPVSGIPVQIQIDILGKLIGKFEYTFEKLEIKSSPFDQFSLFATFVIMFGLVILFIITLLKKIRNDEISIKASIPVGVIIIICTVLEYLVRIEHWDPGHILGGLIIGPSLLGFLGVIAAACADALARDIWNDKLLTLDSLMQGRLFHRFFGQSLLNGILLGFVLIGFSTLIIKIFSFSTAVDMTSWSSNVTDINSWSPFIYRLANSLTNIIWAQFVFVLFLTSFFARFFNKRRWIVLVVAIIWGFGMNLNEFISSPAWLAILFNFSIGAFFVVIFLAFDFVTAFVANLSYLLVFESVRLMHFNNRIYLFDGIGFDLIIVALFIIGLAGLGKVVQREELLKYSPKHVKKLFERERLKRELEIAKRVQLSFLPRTTPNIPNLDVASICYPAEEVGGDYYDFIKIDDHKLGIVIGDVSGKGISAAFYMTLTKGFLRSLTRTPLTPAQVLIEMNSLLYENVERNHFVSMIYGIFDLEKMIFTFARAGHNPVMNRKSDSSTLIICPRGMALGMDKGTLFNSVIEEKMLTINSGDIFIFYTDGFTEAMNKKHQEFGEERLERLLAQLDGQDANMIINSIKESIKDHAGSMAQHDDMTMLVVRVC